MKSNKLLNLGCLLPTHLLVSAGGDTENEQLEINANGKPGLCFPPNILCVIILFLSCRGLRTYNTAIFPARKMVSGLSDRIKYVNISWHFTKKTETSRRSIT